MKTLFLHVLVFSLASSSSTSGDKTVCSEDHLDNSWSRRVPFKTSAHVHYTIENRERTSTHSSSLAFHIKNEWRKVFLVRLKERQGRITSMEFEWGDKEERKKDRLTAPSGKQTGQNQDSQVITICRVDDKWEVRLVTKNHDLWKWESPVRADGAAGEQNLILQAFATTPFSVLLPCEYPDGVEAARARSGYILTVICLTLVALILLACCAHCLFAWWWRRRRSNATSVPRRPSVSKT